MSGPATQPQPELDLTAVLDAVSRWPAADRLELIERLTHALRDEMAGARPRGRKWPIERVTGMLAGDGPPPDDAEVKRIIEEERLKKHG